MGERARATAPEPIYFESRAALRAWFEANHETADELWIGYHRKSTGRPSVTWTETVEECLCFGWIDSVRYSVDSERFRQRLTPRRKGSNWSAVNITKVAQLTAAGRMHPAGIAAFEARRADRSAIYSYERRHEATLEPDEERRFRANEAAWTSFAARSPSVRSTAIWWVVSAKRPETRERRLTHLIEESARGRLPKALTPPARSAVSRA